MSPFEDLKANLAAMIMPAFVLGNAIAAVLMRHTRSAMLQVLSSDYVRTARAKGLDERVVVMKHALRNALIPVITLGALEFGTLLSGAVLTEQVFTIPGFGKLIVDAVFNRDYSVVQGVVLFTATVYITLNLLADVAYFLVLPTLMAAVVFETIHAAPGRRAVRRLARRAGAVFGFAVVVFFILIALLAPGSRPMIRSRRAGARAERRALVRRRRARARRALAHHLGHTRFDPCRRGLGLDLAGARRADRHAHRLPRPVGRRAYLPRHRRDARVPLSHPRHRPRRLPGAEPH